MRPTESFFMIALAAVACTPADSSAAGSDTMRSTKTGSAITEIDRGVPHLVTRSGQTIVLEVARSDQQRARGLMFRESLPENHGMLFVFSESEPHGFWMKNTFIALDMLWLGEDGTIVEIKRDVPSCSADPCPTYVPDAAGLYVLELAAGESDRLGLSAGDRLELRNIQPPPSG